MAFELSGFCHVYLIILKIKAWHVPSQSHGLKILATIILAEHQPKISLSRDTLQDLFILSVPHYFCWLQPQTTRKTVFIMEEMGRQHLSCEMAVASH